MSEHEQGQEQTEQAEKTVETENIEGAGNNEEGDGEATEQINEQETKEKQATSEVEENEKATESSGTPNGASEKIEKESSESEKGLDDEWRTKMEETVLKLRSTLKEKLVKLGIKPEGKEFCPGSEGNFRSLLLFFLALGRTPPPGP